MTIDQLQKPSVAAKLISKFTLTPPMNDRRASRAAVTGTRGRLTAASVLQPVGLTITKTDELVIANTGDDSVLLYDFDGRLIRRVDQRHVMQTRVQQDDEIKHAADESHIAAAGKPDIKSV